MRGSPPELIPYTSGSQAVDDNLAIGAAAERISEILDLSTDLREGGKIGSRIWRIDWIHLGSGSPDSLRRRILTRRERCFVRTLRGGLDRSRTRYF